MNKPPTQHSNSDDHQPTVFDWILLCAAVGVALGIVLSLTITFNEKKSSFNSGWGAVAGGIIGSFFAAAACTFFSTKQEGNNQKDAETQTTEIQAKKRFSIQ